jgi:hypothetical protein
MAELLRRTLGEAIALGTLLAPRLWSVQTDPSEVENAVLNLAINSRDAMPGGGKLLIETANVVLEESDVASEVGGEPGEYVRLSVSDTGAGMSKEVLARAFEPFFTTKGPGKGTGLGLSVIYGFVKQSGGHVTIYSELGRGTTVNVNLPRIATESERKATAKLAAPAAQRTGETILLVEDNPDVRQVTARRLQNLGYLVVEAASGARAVELLSTGAKIDLVFSDVVMPGGMSGFELALLVSTGTVLSVSTRVAWLPSRTRASPRRPWEAMTMRSQPLALAVSMMPSAGKSFARTVSHATSCFIAAALTSPRIRAAFSAAAFSYSSTGKANAASPVTMAVHGSVAVTAVTLDLSCLARARPVVTALPASSDPSVAIKMCLYMAISSCCRIDGCAEVLVSARDAALQNISSRILLRHSTQSVQTYEFTPPR